MEVINKEEMEALIEKGDEMDAGVVKTFKAIEESVVGTYKKIEEGVVGAYQKIEDTVVDAYQNVENKFVGKFLAKDGETVEEAKKRLIDEAKDL